MKNQHELQDELDMIQFMAANNMIDITEAAYFRMRTQSLLRNISRVPGASQASFPQGGAQ